VRSNNFSGEIIEMPGPNLISSVGGQAQKPTKFQSIFTSRFFTGLVTNRSLLRGPLSSIYTDFYHLGTTDVLADGLNSELSARLTMIRRPGNPAYSSAPTAAAIDAFYSFHQSNGTISVIADSTTDVEVVTPSTNTSIFTKTAGAGQGYFQGVDKSLYIADGVDLVKFIPGTTNPSTGTSTWNWGGVLPLTPPSVSVTQTGSAGAVWVASTVFSTMGLIVDANGNVQQMVSVNASGANATQLGTTSNGNPNWNQTPGGTTSDGTITWTNRGPIVPWTANTVYNNETVGGTLANPCIIYDPASDSCYINAAPKLAQGTSSGTKPNFTGVLASVFHDGTVKWFCLGSPKKPGAWQPSHSYPAVGTVTNNDGGSSIAEPVTLPAATNQTVYFQTSGGGTSGVGGTAPQWATTAGLKTTDGDLIWVCQGSATHASNTGYVGWEFGATTFSVIKDGNSNMQVCTTTGTSASVEPGTTATLSAAGNASGGHTTYTGTFPTPFLANYPVSISGFTNSANNGSGFFVVSCNSTTLVVTNTGGVAETHAGTATFNPWGSLYGQTIKDGTTGWVCVGASMSWAASTQWYLPVAGFSPPSPSQPYGSANIVDSNANIQFIISSGKSGTPTHPSWGTIGANTTDNAATWFCTASFTSVGFSWTKGMGYVIAFKARRLSDPYVSTAPPLQLPGTNSPNIVGPLGLPTGCGDGSVTTASPVVVITGANSGAQIKLTGLGSTDPQFDTIEIFRSADGFGTSGPYLFLTDIPMPPTVGQNPGTWSVVDFMPDLPTATLPGLDELIEAPTGDANDPPPGQYGSTQFVPASNGSTTPAAGTTLIGVVYHQGRLWGFIGNSVFASGGPDTFPGNGFTAWPPDQVFPFESNVTRLLPTTAGLLVFTTTDLFLIGGGPDITSYYSQLLIPGLGLLSWNALTIVGGIPYCFTADRQLVSINPAQGFSRVGHPIGDKLSAYDPSQAYVTYHSYGDLDHALFISNGSSEWYRCDVSPSPDNFGEVFSPKATIAGGFKAIQSVEVSPGVRKLLIGPASAGTILARDSSFTTFTDNGSAYSSWFTIGALVLAYAGQMCELNFLEFDFIKVGSQPTVSVLLDEFPGGSPTFETISNSFVTDPPKMYGPTATPSTLWMNRYYFGQTTPGNTNQVPLPAWCKFLFCKVDFGNTDTVMNEALTFTANGALWQEK
jgi:hypothetical protein